MKYPLFIVLLVAVVIAAGCVGGNQNSAVTPTPQIVYVTVLVTVTPSPFVNVTELPVATASPMAVVTSPYFYMDQQTGMFYRQPPGYICTDIHPNYHVGPDGRDYLWCEDKI